MKTICRTTPRANIAGMVTTRLTNGSTLADRSRAKLKYAPKITRAPWPTLMIRITPKINVSPEAISAYTPPVRMPKMTASRMRLTQPSRSPGEGGLGELRLSDGGRWRVDRDRQTVLPLDEEACTVRPAE